ncbi:AAA family ATPase [Hydrogenimonas thermophila]|uniref:ATP-binding protein n=1 Tax=Hydrogenimonas thermophila TaxID=223786 RepID=UPI002936D896|nr:AAA family ATPase [Hydrogenimonas thermophila]WOE69571.1 AAA family ATPase [Hydrogenimonas thermophila]WOE72085.1 AAA family ATPase [Hydrogenimonas thermophila]
MLDELRIKYDKISKLITSTYKRYFYEKIDFDNKLIGVLGARGIGKTTFLIQYLKEFDFDKTLYFSADSIIASGVKLYDIAEEFSRYGGEILAIDEIHKIKNFEIELKEIYDFLDLKVLFSGSSAISLEHSKADLSRRAVLYRFKGLSFREFLELKLGKSFQSFTLDEILENHTNIANSLTKEFKPFVYFKEYLEFGYYPYYFEAPKSYKLKVEESINTVIENDLLYIFHIDIANIDKLKQLIKLLCLSKPYELNLTNLAKDIGIGRETLYRYIHYLTLGNVLCRVDMLNKKQSHFKKPAKLYLDNPNLTYTFCKNSEIGTVREQFFINSISINHKVNYSKIGDFLIDEKYIVEIGGKNKSFDQIKDLPNSFLAVDDIEIGYKTKIPLWLFGFLY